MKKPCNTCNGTGILRRKEITCPDCDGEKLIRYEMPGYGETVRRCTRCDETGKRLYFVGCPVCQGSGEVS